MPYVSFEDVLLSEPLGPNRERELGSVVESLLDGGMGLIPTDTQHAYVTSVSSKRGTQRIYAAKGIDPEERKPLSLLCSSLSMASRYADVETVPKRWFQLMKRLLPGPFTFILQATKDVPRVVIEHKSRRRLWERREVGIRVPDCAVVKYLTEQIGEPLLASSFCKVPAELWSAKRGELDFVVAATDIQRMWDGVVEEDRISTVLDLTMEEPVLRRQGLGDVSAFFE